jgi:hypothetical protein
VGWLGGTPRTRGSVLAVGLVWGFGTLLGPEETSRVVVGCVFGPSSPRASNACRPAAVWWWVVWVVVWGVVGCGCLLSVA